MADQKNQNTDSIYFPSDDLMLGEGQEGEEIQLECVDTEEQDQDYCLESKESSSEEGGESEDDLDSKQKSRERANRSRLSSFSSNKSQSSAGASSAFGSLKALNKAARGRSPYVERESAGNKRERSSNSSVDDSFKKVLKQKKPLPSKSIDLISAAGNQDKRVQNPPVIHTPTAPAKSVKPRQQFVQPQEPAENKKQNMASKHTSNQSNTDEFSVVEQNSERVNITDIAKIPEIATAVLLLSRGDGLKTVQSFVSAGKKFSDAIARSRSSGKKFIRAIGMIVNIQTDPDQVTHTDLTKQRMMALCHKILYQSGECSDYNSPLVGRINFNKENPLTKIRPLLGAGFQFLGRVVVGSYEREHYKEGLLLFHLGCIALDYIRKTSSSYDARSDSQRDAMINPNEVDFVSYACDDIAGEGEVFIAGCRNLDQSALTVLEENSTTFYNMVCAVSIGKYGGSLGHRVAHNFSSVANEMRKLLDVDGMVTQG